MASMFTVGACYHATRALSLECAVFGHLGIGWPVFLIGWPAACHVASLHSLMIRHVVF